MSEKRFTLRTNSVSTNYPSGRIFDNKKQHSLYLDEVVDCLNEQQATIEQLQRICETINSLYNINHLREENEQLKKENRVLKKDLNKLYSLLIDKGMNHNELQDMLW